MSDNLTWPGLYWASFNRLELRLPLAAVLDIAQSGANDAAVQKWKSAALFPISDYKTSFRDNPALPDLIRHELQEYGAWDETQLADNERNLERLVWLAAWNIAEDECPDNSEPVNLTATA